MAASRWRAAASIICVGPNQLTTSRHPSVFMVKRHSEAAFMPSSWVYPGGTLHATDSAPQWSTLTKWDQHKPSTATLPIYDDLKEQNRGSCPELALRIAALRELYEECGVLAVNDCDNVNSLRCISSDVSDNMNFADPASIRDDPGLFLKMFIGRTDIVPAVTHLFDWANWLTPHTQSSARRFDTVFYVLCLKETFTAEHCIKELEGHEWRDIDRTLSESQSNKFRLAPPQIYHMAAELSQVATADELKELAQKRIANNCIQRICPQFVRCKNNVTVSLFNGDSHYITRQGGVDVPPLITEWISADEFRAEAEILHRCEFPDMSWSHWRGFISDPICDQLMVKKFDIATENERSRL